MISMAAPLLLRRARAAYDGELMLMKGPEVAARYPHPSDRASMTSICLPRTRLQPSER